MKSILIQDVKTKEYKKLIYNDMDKFNTTKNMLLLAEKQNKCRIIYIN